MLSVLTLFNVLMVVLLLAVRSTVHMRMPPNIFHYLSQRQIASDAATLHLFRAVRADKEKQIYRDFVLRRLQLYVHSFRMVHPRTGKHRPRYAALFRALT